MRPAYSGVTLPDGENALKASGNAVVWSAICSVRAGGGGGEDAAPGWPGTDALSGSVAATRGAGPMVTTCPADPTGSCLLSALAGQAGNQEVQTHLFRTVPDGKPAPFVTEGRTL